MTQGIRLSRFVFTWGSGAILEGRYGPRVIPRPDIGIFTPNPHLEPGNFMITDRRMSEGLLKGAEIFKLPSNSELGMEESRYIYRTKPFPDWNLCLNNREHEEDFYVLYRATSCPVCHRSDGYRKETIRFIVACPDGHMDDVNWSYLVHRKQRTSCGHKNWFHWYGGGGALSRIEIECPKCGSRKNLGASYNVRWECSGRSPEHESLDEIPVRNGCEKDALMIQRQASNLRIPELRTLFTVLWYTDLHNLLQKREIYSNLVGRGIPGSKKELEEILDNLLRADLISQRNHDSILENSWSEILRAIDDIRRPVPFSYNALILEEFGALINASVNGAPPVRLSHHRSPVIFEVIPEFVRKFYGPNETIFRITPVQRLRTVTVQKGYRREVDTKNPARIVDTGFSYNEKKWYPGVEFLGEGIFILLEKNEGWCDQQDGDSADKWISAFNDPSSYLPYLFRDAEERTELHPGFVWWHTLSHLLIRTISVEAGYSSASIRERVYLEINGPKVRGGVLLYATQPGSDGTLGGLIALVPYFQDILESAFDQLETCSGDPLCVETRFQKGKYNGAACYSCLLLSETSCEHRNMWLDRNIVAENLP